MLTALINLLLNISIISTIQFYYFTDDSTFRGPQNKNNNNFLQCFKYIKFQKEILPCNKLLYHFHYINHFISYKIVNDYICVKITHR